MQGRRGDQPQCPFAADQHPRQAEAILLQNATQKVAAPVAEQCRLTFANQGCVVGQQPGESLGQFAQLILSLSE